MSTAAPPSDPVSTRNPPLPTAEHLPDDPDTLKRMILELLATLHQERHQTEHLRARLDLLLRRLYGPRSERSNPDQPLLFANTEGIEMAPNTPAAESAATASVPPAKRRQAKPHGRRPIPEDLPRRPVHHELSESDRVCSCGAVRVDIGTDTSEQLDWQPASYFVWQHVTHKYACPDCVRKSVAQSLDMPVSRSAATTGTDETLVQSNTREERGTQPASEGSAGSEPLPASQTQPTDTATLLIGPAVVSASKPAMPIDKGLPGPGLLAHVIVSKYLDHLPLYRQENISERHGIFIPRSTSCDWMAKCAELLRPLYDIMVAQVLQSQWLHTDDTPVKNLGHAPGTTAQARFWGYLGDTAHPFNVFDFTVNRKRDGPQTFLANFHGYLHADAFTGYDALYLPSPRTDQTPILEVACNAHARRKFHEARGTDAARSHQALAYYSQLYEIERRAKEQGLDEEKRRQVRQDLAVPILARFRTWLESERPKVLPKSPMGEAFTYALNNWTALVRYTEAGFLSIDNNAAEREMKRIAIGRKNWLFVGSEKGGHTAAVLISFTSTCHRLGLNSWAYLHDVLTRLPRTTPEQRDDLLPNRWQAAHKQAAATTVEPQASAAASADSIP
jgi:transposase